MSKFNINIRVNGNENYPPKIENSELLDQNQIIKLDLIENLDFIILPKSIAYFFHDVYHGDRRLKTKNRHIYTVCENQESKKNYMILSL